MTFEVKIEADDKPRRLHVCTVCDKQFTTKGSLHRHKQIHTRQKLYSCIYCEKRFATQQYLRQHMNVHGSKYKCTKCGKCFGSSTYSMLHRQRHCVGEPLCECTACGKRFAASCAFSHKHHCAKLLKSTSDSKHQIIAQTVAKPYSCRLCPSRFSQLSELLAHLQNSHAAGSWLTCA